MIVIFIFRRIVSFSVIHDSTQAIKPGSSYRSILPQTIPFLDALASLESMLESE